MSRGAFQAVQLASGPVCEASLASNSAALSQGSSTLGLAAAMNIGLVIEGLSWRRSRSLTPARSATLATSMSRWIGTASKKGWLPIAGSRALKRAGLATMFLIACSFGTYWRVSCGMLMSA